MNTPTIIDVTEFTTVNTWPQELSRIEKLLTTVWLASLIKKKSLELAHAVWTFKNQHNTYKALLYTAPHKDLFSTDKNKVLEYLNNAPKLITFHLRDREEVKKFQRLEAEIHENSRSGTQKKKPTNKSKKSWKNVKQ